MAKRARFGAYCISYLLLISMFVVLGPRLTLLVSAQEDSGNTLTEPDKVYLPFSTNNTGAASAEVVYDLTTGTPNSNAWQQFALAFTSREIAVVQSSPNHIGFPFVTNDGVEREIEFYCEGQGCGSSQQSVSAEAETTVRTKISTLFASRDIEVTQPTNNRIVFSFRQSGNERGTAMLSCSAADCVIKQRLSTHVKINGHQFSPANVTIGVGETIIWTRSDGEHNVQADDGSFGNELNNSWTTYAHTFEETGTYPYFCQAHGGPDGVGMSGVVTVDTSTTPPTDPPNPPSPPVQPNPELPTDPQPGALSHPVVFVSRQIPQEGSVYWGEVNGMPGVGPYSRFQVAAPGKLMILEPSGALRTLVDGANPTAASLNLIDVNAPDVSYNGQQIVFAGLPNGNYNLGTGKNLNAWRIYVINVDGTGLRQITNSDLVYSQLDLTQFDGVFNNNSGYDDTDPIWMPDGRIVFVSTRWPSFAQYSGVRTSNLHIVNADGSNLHRITSERNGADRPLIDPITGKIVFSRWWRNHRSPVDSFETILEPAGGYVQFNGLTAVPRNTSGRPAHMVRNSWQLGSINPDGSDLDMWTGHYRDVDVSHIYGGAFTPDGKLIANYFPMFNMTEAAGFGGLRRYQRGAALYEPLVGVTWQSLDYVKSSGALSYGVFHGTYAAEPDVLPDGRIVFSWAKDIYQDYGLYLMDPDGTGHILLYDNPGTTELRARVVRSRPVPPIIAETVTNRPGPLPAPAEGPYDQDGTFVFDALNVYFNAPVDVPIVNAPAVGSAQQIRFFIDHQRTNPGSFANLDWPILLDELPVSPAGAVRNENVPANVPLFEQLRALDGSVPLTFGPSPGGQGGGPLRIPGAVGGPLRIDGTAHVGGMNYGSTGSVQRCVGCHAGHTLIEVPDDDEDALWTNLAPGAEVRVSSTRSASEDKGVIDRRVMNGSIHRYWSSAPGQTENQWVELVFPVPVTIRNVRLYNPRQGDIAESTLRVHEATVRLYSDSAGTVEVASKTSGELAVSGTDVFFDEVRARVVRVELDSVSGRFFGSRVAGLAEIEVIARGEAGP